MAAIMQVSDTVLLDRLEDIVRAGERIELDHGEGNGFLAGSHVGPSLREALAGLVDGQSGAPASAVSSE
jgi:hypothetical protein